MDVFFVIKCKARDGTLEYVLNGDPFVVGNLTQHVAKVKGNRACEVNFQILIVFVLHYVVLVELCEAVIDQLVAIWLFQMLEYELGKACQECTWAFLLVYFFQELFTC